MIDNTEYYMGGGLGLIYVSSDSIFEAPQRDFESTRYPEQNGENILPKTTMDAFDYKVKFFIASDNLVSANTVIALFNSMLYTQPQNSDVKTFKQVSFFNDYKGVKIVGYPKLIADTDSFWRDSKGEQHDAVVVEWTIHVPDPGLCDFNYTRPQ